MIAVGNIPSLYGAAVPRRQRHTAGRLRAARPGRPRPRVAVARPGRAGWGDGSAASRVLFTYAPGKGDGAGCFSALGHAHDIKGDGGTTHVRHTVPRVTAGVLSVHRGPAGPLVSRCRVRRLPHSYPQLSTHVACAAEGSLLAMLASSLVGAVAQCLRTAGCHLPVHSIVVAERRPQMGARVVLRPIPHWISCRLRRRSTASPPRARARLRLAQRLRPPTAGAAQCRSGCRPCS
jgi:hypothetical protein